MEEMSMYELRARVPGNKHAVCMDADTELALVSHRIDAIRALFSRTCVHRQLTATLPAVRPLPEKMIQGRMTALEQRLPGLACYVRLPRPPGVPPVQLGDESGHVWFKGFCNMWQAVQHDFRLLQQDVILNTLILLAQCLRQHPADAARIKAAVVVLMAELTGSRDPDDPMWRDFWQPKVAAAIAGCQCRMDGPEWASTAAACRQYLRLWHATHALDLPAVHGVVYALAW